MAETRNYTLYVNSADKVGGDNNSATYNVDWGNLLPQAYNEFKVNFCLTTAPGYYKDASDITYSAARVKADFGGARNFCYDTQIAGPGTTIGTISRDQQTSTTASSILSCLYHQNTPKTIARPTQNTLTLTITNMCNNTPLVTTDSNGTAASDMSNYTAQFEFIPIGSSLNEPRRFQDL